MSALTLVRDISLSPDASSLNVKLASLVYSTGRFVAKLTQFSHHFVGLRSRPATWSLGSPPINRPDHWCFYEELFMLLLREVYTCQARLVVLLSRGAGPLQWSVATSGSGQSVIRACGLIVSLSRTFLLPQCP